MIPQEKSKNFHDLSISGIHVIRFSGVELHNLIERCRYSRISTSATPAGWRAPDYPSKGKEIDCWDDWYDGDEWDEEYNSDEF